MEILLESLRLLRTFVNSLKHMLQKVKVNKTKFKNVKISFFDNFDYKDFKGPVGITSQVAWGPRKGSCGSSGAFKIFFQNFPQPIFRHVSLLSRLIVRPAMPLLEASGTDNACSILTAALTCFVQRTRSCVGRNGLENKLIHILHCPKKV